MELLNPDQLQCSACRGDVVETEYGWIHLDGSIVDDCKAEPTELVTT